MTLFKPSTWETATALALAASGAACVVWWVRRKRPSADEIEQARRLNLALTGRLVDGMLLDVRTLPVDEGRTLTMLEYSYRIGGVEYECCQDITMLPEIVSPAEVRAGSPVRCAICPAVPKTASSSRSNGPGCAPACPRLRRGPIPERRHRGNQAPKPDRHCSRDIARFPARDYTDYMHVHAAPTGPGASRTQSVLRISLIATLLYVVITFVAGLRAHSLALLSEAGHNVSDFLALLLSFVAVYFQTRPANDSKTFGYQRAGVLAAFVNASTLIVIALWIGVEAIHRLSAPVVVQPKLMMMVAAAGVIMNGVIAALLWGVARDVNLRSAFLHMAGDTLSTAAVIAGGFGILLSGQNWIDPALSLVIAALILWSSIGIVRETLNILLEGTPRGMKLERIESAIREIAGVNDVHDLHVWSIGSETHALSCHISIEDIPPSVSERILRDVKECLHHDFRIVHTTIQFEHAECEVAHGCVMPVAESEAHHHHHSH